MSKRFEEMGTPTQKVWIKGKFFKCLQRSLEIKKKAEVTFEPMGLKITGCENK